MNKAVKNVLLGVTVLAACAGPPPTPSGVSVSVRRANPASENCVAAGGALSIQKSGAGEYGLCSFPENRQCEEWAMLRGECPVGGIRVAGYVTPAARYCAITGGRYAVTAASNTPDERGSCTFKDGASCDAQAYHEGRCSRATAR